MRRLAFGFAALALAACQPQTPASPAATATSPLAERAAVAEQAAERFATIAQGSETSGQPPRQTDPNVASLLDQVLDTSALPASPTAADITPINDWLLAAVKVNQVYALAGTGMTDAQATPSAAASARADSNLATFAPEIGRALDAEAILLGTEGAAIAQVGAGGGGDPAAYQQVQSQVAQAYAGSLGVIGRPELADPWKEARAKVLVSMAPQVAPLLSPQDRQALQTAARQVAAKNTDATLQAELNDFAAKIAPAAA